MRSRTVNQSMYVFTRSAQDAHLAKIVLMGIRRVRMRQDHENLAMGGTRIETSGDSIQNKSLDRRAVNA